MKHPGVHIRQPVSHKQIGNIPSHSSGNQYGKKYTPYPEQHFYFFLRLDAKSLLQFAKGFFINDYN
jgi:hypothetical protein